MKKLYAPWRGEYTSGTARSQKKKECVFCEVLKEKNDSENFILKRLKHNYVILNRYPYNAGHLLIIPMNHKSKLSDLSKAGRAEFIELIATCEKLVRDTLKAQGVNIGINQERAAGAGIPAHLHCHILPRWEGDTNFLPLLSDTKQVSFPLNKVYKQLKKELDKRV